MQFRIYSEKGDYGRNNHLSILIEGVNGVVQVAAPLEFKDVGDPGIYHDPVWTIDRATQYVDTDGAGCRHVSVLDGRALIQAFMDHGWELGMRPTGVADADTTKQVAALGAHLKDMQKLVFEQPRVILPGPPERDNNAWLKDFAKGGV